MTSGLFLLCLEMTLCFRRFFFLFFSCPVGFIWTFFFLNLVGRNKSRGRDCTKNFSCSSQEIITYTVLLDFLSGDPLEESLMPEERDSCFFFPLSRLQEPGYCWQRKKHTCYCKSVGKDYQDVLERKPVSVTTRFLERHEQECLWGIKIQEQETEEDDKESPGSCFMSA